MISLGQWGTICDDWFSDIDADVICRTGGYSGGRYNRGSYNQRNAPKANAIWLDNLYCRGLENNVDDCRQYLFCRGENNIDDCPRIAWGKHNCKHSEDVGIMCFGKYYRVMNKQEGGSNNSRIGQFFK